MNQLNQNISEIIASINNKAVTLHQLNNERYDIISIKNNSKSDISIEAFENLIKLTTYLRSNNIEYSIS